MIALFSYVIMTAAPVKIGTSDTNYELTGAAPELTLTLSGTGAIPDFEQGQAPWNSNAASITDVIVEEGISCIGENAFNMLDSLKTMKLLDTTNPDGVIFCDNHIRPFGNVRVDLATLYVAYEKMELYKEHTYWSMFGSILPLACPTSGTIEPSAGQTGSSVVWAIANGTLTIQGFGIIPDYEYGQAPWACDANAVTDIIVYAGVCSFGRNAFSSLVNLKSMTVLCTDPDNILQGNVFGNVDCTKITLYVPFEAVEAYKEADIWKGFKEILPDACPMLGTIPSTSNNPADIIYWDIQNGILTFSGKGFMIPDNDGTAPWTCDAPSITDIVVGADIQRFGAANFSNFVNLGTVTVFFPVPPEINSSLFGNLPLENITLGVPAGTVADYKAAAVWMRFNIVEMTCATSGVLPGNTRELSDVIDWAVEDGTLIFGGKGNLLLPEAGLIPWMCDVEAITNVIVGDGILSIADNAISGLYNVRDITLPWTVEVGAVLPVTSADFLPKQNILELTIHVPVGMKSAYLSISPEWGRLNVVEDAQSVQVEVTSDTSAEVGWEPVPDAVSYEVNVYGDMAQTDLIHNERVNANTPQPASKLKAVTSAFSVSLTNLQTDKPYYVFTSALDKDDKVLAENVSLIVLKSVTAVSETAIDRRIRFAPNPATDYIIVSGLPAGAEIIIIDLAGRVCLRTVETAINVSPLATGAYIVRSGEFVGKMVKK